MRSERAGREGGRVGQGLAIGGAALLLGAWPVTAHLQWDRGEGLFHGVPAFFLGAAVWLLGLGLCWLAVGLWRNGLRWVMSRDAWSRLGALLALGVSLAALFHTVEAWRGRKAWMRAEREALARGMTLDMRSMVPPEVPAGLDFGQAPMFEPLHRRLKAKETAVAGPADLGPLAGLLRWAQSRPLPGAGGGNRPGWMVGRSRWANLGPGGRREATPEAEVGAEAATLARAFLARVQVHAPLLEEARRHAERPHSRMPFDYQTSFLADTTSEQVLLALQRLAFSRAHALVLLGRGEEALGDLELGLRLVRHGRALPWLFQSGRRAMQVAHGMDAVWEGLSGRIWDEAGLVRLQQALEASRGSGEMSPGRTQLRTTALATVGFLEGLIPTDRGSASTGFRAGLPEQERSLFEWVRWFYPTGWSLQDQAAVVSGWILLDTGEAFDPREDAAFVRAMRATSDPVYQVFVLPKVRQMMTDAMVSPRFEADAVRLAASACAVERFRNREARLPESMEEVASMGLPPMEGTSGDADRLRYRKEPGGGYRVYSTGLDGRDDGGGLPTDPGPGGGAMAPEGLMDWSWVGVGSVTKPSTEGTIQ